MPTARTGAASAKSTRSNASDLTAIVKMLAADHAEVDKMFKRYEKLKEADDDARQELIPEICAALTVHATVEEELFYPAARDALEEDDQDMIDEADVEHEHIKMIVEELKANPDDQMCDAKVKVLGEYVKHHVEEEEDELFPALKKAKADLEGVFEQMEARKAELTADEEKAN